MSQTDNTTGSQKSKHLNSEERKIIERLLRKGINKAEIGRILKRDKSTIKREIKRGSVKQRRQNPYASRNKDVPDYLEETVYFWEVGQRLYEKKRQNCGAKNKVIECKAMVEYVEGMIHSKKKWSPDTAIGYAKVNNLFPGQKFCTKTFYNWIDDKLVNVKNIDLLLKVRRRPKSPRRERKKKLGKSIDERPDAANTREEYGHWEGDGIVGKEQHGHLISLVERKTGIGMLFNVYNKDQKKAVGVLNSLEKDYGKHFREIFKSITFDNGPEFSDSAGMEAGGRTQIYYAHPYSSFERGTNENWNGIVRRFIPKGRSFTGLTDKDMNRIANYINTMPRKRFGYRSPLDLWNEQIDAIMSV